MKFSVLMCLYAGENPAFFSVCLGSIAAQTALPDELVLVKDGPLTVELEEVIQSYHLPFYTNVVTLPENVTLGPARAEGVRAARNDWVAIMDSDDICHPDRFRKQLDMIRDRPSLGLMGGQIAEFADDPKVISATRVVPCGNDDIVKCAKKRNPFNSMTVMFRREMALAAGNYRYFPWFEDYDLWVRMIKSGVACANSPDVLVSARVGSGMYARRRGIPYIRSEWQMQKHLKESGLINSAEFVRNSAQRIPVRLLPEKALAAVYNKYARG